MANALPDTSILAPAVASLLGPDWSAYPDEDGQYHRAWFLRHRDGRRVRLSVEVSDFSRDRGRLHAAGYLPDKPDDVDPDTSDIERGSISMAGTKTAPQVAREISRRLLPTLTEALAAWNAKVTRLRAHEVLRTEVAERLARIPGISTPARTPWRPRSSQAWHLSWNGTPRGAEGSTWRYATTPSARLDVDAGDTGEHVGIELAGLSAEQAARAMRALVRPERDELPARQLSARLRSRFHRTARFWPARRDEPGTLPALQVAGAMVFVYLDENTSELRVSVDLDTVHRALLRPGGDHTVPLRITVQGETVFRG